MINICRTKLAENTCFFFFFKLWTNQIKTKRKKNPIHNQKVPETLKTQLPSQSDFHSTLLPTRWREGESCFPSGKLLPFHCSWLILLRSNALNQQKLENPCRFEKKVKSARNAMTKWKMFKWGESFASLSLLEIYLYPTSCALEALREVWGLFSRWQSWAIRNLIKWLEGIIYY